MVIEPDGETIEREIPLEQPSGLGGGPAATVMAVFDGPGTRSGASRPTAARASTRTLRVPVGEANDMWSTRGPRLRRQMRVRPKGRDRRGGDP